MFLATYTYSLLLLTGSALVGGLIAFMLRSKSERNLQLILSFSGAYLFSICLLHLFPELFHSDDHSMGLYVLGGFFVQLFLEQLSKGAEHGHIHGPHGSAHGSFLISVMLGLSIHAFMEGIPVATQQFSSHALLYGIAMHKMPAAFALVSIGMLATNKKLVVVGMLIVFALMSPLGFILGSSLVDDHDVFSKIMALVLGSFLHISTTILFESGSSSHQFNILKIIAIFAGVGLSLLTLH